MADETTNERVPLLRQRRVHIGVGILVLIVAGVVAWLWLTAGQESTDDAQVDGDVTPIAARVGGTVEKVLVSDNQRVEVGTILVQIDERDYRVAVDKARAELADAQAAAAAAQANVPIASTQATSQVTTAQGGLAQAQSAVVAAQKQVDAAQAAADAAQARQREAEANSTKAARDVERLRGLLAKDEVSQQQFDAANAAAEAQKAAVDSARSQVAQAEAAIRVAESQLAQARAGEQRARADVATAGTGPQQIAATKARAEAAAAHIQQEQAAVEQADLNLQYTTIKAPVTGVIGHKSVQPGQIVQAGQPLMALIPLANVWVTANFKETQLTSMRAGQKASFTVDALDGREFRGHVDSIAPATGARFSLLPPENATGNYVKVVQRVPVKIVLEPGQDPDRLLRPGMSVVATVYTK